MSVRIIPSDVMDGLAQLPDASVHTVVTSPPYFGLRDYGVPGQIGLEATPDEYVAKLVAVFREVRRVLRDDGTLWLNLGDSYAGGGNYRGINSEKTLSAKQRSNGGARGVSQLLGAKNTPGLKPKDLIGIPWRVAFALQADGWVLRQEIVWAKPNPMPESVRDRCTKSHEQIFMFAKATWSGPEPGRFASISDEDARWLALLIDAEGCIVAKRVNIEGRAPSFAPQVSIGNTSEALMREVVRIVGHGSLLERPGKNCRMLYWQLSSGVAADFLRRIYPFLIVKQRQARIGIHIDSLTYYRGGKLAHRKERSAAEAAVLESLWQRNKLCNQFGDPDLTDVPEPQIGRWAGCERYYFDQDAIKEPQSENTHERFGKNSQRSTNTPKATEPGRGIKNNSSMDAALRNMILPGGRNRRSVWTIGTYAFPEAHFATFPPALVEPCILAGCPKDGTVLDPFGGAGTTGLVADRLGRDAVLIELNPEYAAMASRRIRDDAPLLSAGAA